MEMFTSVHPVLIPGVDEQTWSVFLQLRQFIFVWALVPLHLVPKDEALQYSQNHQTTIFPTFFGIRNLIFVNNFKNIKTPLSASFGNQNAGENLMGIVF